MANFDTPMIIKEHTGSTYTITTGDYGAVHTNRGGGACTYTLPAPSAALKGVWLDIFVVVAGDQVIETSAGDQMVLLNDAAATRLTIGTNGEEIGNGVHLVCDGTSWLCFVNLAAEAVTLTVGA